MARLLGGKGLERVVALGAGLVLAVGAGGCQQLGLVPKPSSTPSFTGTPTIILLVNGTQLALPTPGDTQTPSSLVIELVGTPTTPTPIGFLDKRPTYTSTPTDTPPPTREPRPTQPPTSPSANPSKTGTVSPGTLTGTPSRPAPEAPRHRSLRFQHPPHFRAPQLRAALPARQLLSRRPSQARRW